MSVIPGPLSAILVFLVQVPSPSEAELAACSPMVSANGSGSYDLFFELLGSVVTGLNDFWLIKIGNLLDNRMRVGLLRLFRAGVGSTGRLHHEKPLQVDALSFSTKRRRANVL